MSFHPPMMEQMAMASFTADGEFTRYIRRIRGLYSARRDCLFQTAGQQLADHLQLERTQAGLHLVGWLPEAADEQIMTTQAAQAGVTLYPLSNFRLAATGCKGIVLGFGAFDEKSIIAGVQQLALAWRTIAGKQKCALSGSSSG